MREPDLKGIRLVAIDMDGTLLNDQKEITPATRNCIDRLQQKGIYPVLVTGRSYEALKPYKEALGLSTPVICYNGSQIIDGETEKILLDKYLSDESSRFIIDFARREDIHVQAYRNGMLYYERQRKESDYYESHVNLRGEIVVFEKMEPFHFTKMMYVGEHACLEKAAEKAASVIGGQTSILFSNTEFLEFMHKSVSKGAALRYVLEQMSLSPAQTIAFGDGDNDISMIEAAGIGIAMENASSAVKAAADFIAPSNNDNGIARFLAPLCL